MCRKMKRMDDYKKNVVFTKNSCPALSKFQNYLAYRRFQYTQFLSLTMTNNYVLEFNQNLLNSTIFNANMSQSQNSISKKLNSSISNLENELKNYTSELAYQLSSLSNFSNYLELNEMEMQSFCGCNDVEHKSTTIWTTMSTNPALTTKSTYLISNVSGPEYPLISTSTVSTTTLAPMLNPVCSNTRIVTDIEGNYIKTACLLQIPVNGFYANSFCQANSMQLMTIDSSMTQTALTIFIQDTLMIGSYWISGGNGTGMCKYLTVNGTSSSTDQDRCSDYNYNIICEYKDPNVPAKIKFRTNVYACRFVSPILDDVNLDNRYACIMAYARSYIDSNFICIINGMKLFNISDNSIVSPLSKLLGHYFGSNSGTIIWVNGPAKAGSCSYFNGTGSKFSVGSGNCDKFHWSICEPVF